MGDTFCNSSVIIYFAYFLCELPFLGYLFVSSAQLHYPIRFCHCAVPSLILLLTLLNGTKHNSGDKRAVK